MKTIECACDCFHCINGDCKNCTCESCTCTGCNK